MLLPLLLLFASSCRDFLVRFMHVYSLHLTDVRNEGSQTHHMLGLNASSFIETLLSNV